MERWPLCVTGLLTGLFTLWQGCGAQSQAWFTIQAVGLTLHPGSVVESGTPVTLQCAVKVSHSPDLHLAYTFNFLLNDELVYSKNASDQVVSHFLQPARAANSGTYRCQVRIEEKSRNSNSERLTVTGLETPTLWLQPDIVFEGEEVTAKCSAPNELGPFSFFFYENGEQVRQQRTTSNHVETKLTPKRLGDTYLHCNYAVAMQSEAGLSNNSNTVKAIVNELQITPEIRILPTKIVIEGDRLEVECKVQPSQPRNLEVFLTKGNKVLHKYHTSFNHNLSARTEDSGEYVCKSEKGSVQKTDSDTVTVTELFSKPVLTMEPREVFEGDAFTLSCRSARVSSERIMREDVRYSLYRDNLPVAERGNYSATAETALNGYYFCQAEAKGILKNSTEMLLKAKIPVSVPVISVVGRVIVRKPFQILCRSENGSLPIRYSLRRVGQVVGTTSVRRPTDHALFNIQAIGSREEIQGFTCQAQNNPLRSSSQSPPLNASVIEPVSKPVLMVEPKGYAITEGSDVTLSCRILQGTPPVNFTWYQSGQRLPLTAMHNVNNVQGSHTVQSIGRGQRGSYYCEASNAANESQRSALVTIGVNLAGWKKALIAVFCILLMLAIVIVLLTLMKKSLNPCGRKKRTAELSVKPAKPKSDDPLRVSLCLDAEENTAPNVSPGVMGRNVWSNNMSGSESDAQSSEDAEKLQYTEVVHPQEADPTRAPVKKDTETVYSEVSPEGATDRVDGISEGHVDGQGSLEYAQLNHSELEPV